MNECKFCMIKFGLKINMMKNKQLFGFELPEAAPSCDSASNNAKLSQVGTMSNGMMKEKIII